jgi:nucleoside 2-deoxyribosyltransferase
MKKKTVIYLAAPYTWVNKSKEIGLSKPDYSEIEKRTKQERFELINEAAAKLTISGFAVISPISQNHVIAENHNLPDAFDFWEDDNLNILARCDMLFVLTIKGWDISQGVQSEIAFAEQNQIPIIYIDNELRISYRGLIYG